MLLLCTKYERSTGPDCYSCWIRVPSSCARLGAGDGPGAFPYKELCRNGGQGSKRTRTDPLLPAELSNPLSAVLCYRKTQHLGGLVLLNAFRKPQVLAERRNGSFANHSPARAAHAPSYVTSLENRSRLYRPIVRSRRIPQRYFALADASGVYVWLSPWKKTPQRSWHRSPSRPGIRGPF